MLRRFTRGKDSSPAKPANQTAAKKDQKPSDAEGFLCPMCMARLPGPAELQNHFEKAHSDGGVKESAAIADSDQAVGELINIEEDQIDVGQKTQLQFSAENANEEVVFLQQEMAELATAIKEEKWYSGQLKEELDKVSKERDKMEEEREMFQEQYDSKLRSAEESYLQVATENEKLKDELRYADIKSLKERDTKLNAEIESLKLDLSQEKEMKSAVEEANKHMMVEIERKDKSNDDLNFKLKERPTNANVILLENEIKSLKEQIKNVESQSGKNSEEEISKWRQNADGLKAEITKQEIVIKELELEKSAKNEQMQTVQNTLNAALETSKQAQQQSREKQQQIIDLQHETRETQTALKEKAAFILHLEKQLDDSRSSLATESKEKQDLQQKIRTLENSLDAGSRDANEKDVKLKEFESLLRKEKSEMQRLESERSDLVAKIEAGSGVETAINQLRQEKEKLIEGLANVEKEMMEQGKRHTAEIDVMRGEKSKLKEEIDVLKDQNLSLEKKSISFEEDVEVKQKSIADLKSDLREKADEMHKQESERSLEKASFEKEVQELRNSLQGKCNDASVLEQKVSKISADLESMTSSKTELEKQLDEIQTKNEKLEKDLAHTTSELSTVINTGKTETERLNEQVEKLKAALEERENQLKNEKQDKEGLEASFSKTNAELKEKIATGSQEIASLQLKIEEDAKHQENMQKEFAVLRENEDSLKDKIHGLEEEFKNQKEQLNQQLLAVKTKADETENRFKAELHDKENLLETVKTTLGEEIEQQKNSFSEKELKYKEDLKLKEGEIFFISESTKEAVAGYEKSIEMLEESIKNAEQRSEQLEIKIKKIEEEKEGVLRSLEQKDITFHEVQRKLEVAEAELKKKCESCKNYEIQLCRFQETHKEQISTVSNLQGQIENLSNNLKLAKETNSSLEEEFGKHKQIANQHSEDLKKELEQSKEVNAVLEARVLELDDELKEAYNKFDRAKEEMSMLTADLHDREGREIKLREEKASLENEIKDLKIAEESYKLQLEQEIEDGNIRIDGILKQKIEIEEKLKESEDLIEKEKKSSAATKNAMEKMQNVLKEKIEAILTKVQNIEREKEDLLKTKEQSEARLNMEIKSLNENFGSSRREIEDKNKKIDEINQLISRMEQEKENLRGDVAVMEVQIQNINDEKRALTERVLQSEDAHKRTKERLTDTNRRLEQALAALQELGQENQSIQMQQNFKLSRQWEDDSLVTNCKTCDKLFSLTIRKHHCRHCGAIFCNDCSSNYTQVAASKKAVRVCDHCHTELNTMRGRRLSAASMT